MLGYGQRFPAEGPGRDLSTPLGTTRVGGGWARTGWADGSLYARGWAEILRLRAQDDRIEWMTPQTRTLVTRSFDRLRMTPLGGRDLDKLRLTPLQRCAKMLGRQESPRVSSTGERGLSTALETRVCCLAGQVFCNTLQVDAIW